MRTYSRNDRKRTRDDEPAAKRRRICTESSESECAGSSSLHDQAETTIAQASLDSSSSIVPSSPTREILRSPGSCASRPSTPPSSPPPTTSTTRCDEPDTQGHGLKKRTHSSPKPVNHTVMPLAVSDARRLNRSSAKPKKPPKYTQLHLDFGQKVRIRCQSCGMEYAPSIPEDAAVHKKFHNLNSDGVELGRAFVESEACQLKVVWRGNEGDCIVKCTWRDAKTLRNKVRAVLDVVDTELGAVKIEDERLWADKETDVTAIMFDALLYLRGSRCVGLCLVEELKMAYKVIAEEHSPSAAATKERHRRALKTLDTPDAMVIGITRIWTASSQRKGGLATRLLDCARGNAVYGRELPKKHIAFSQPTESGAALARKWYGKETGWHVYTE